MNRRQKSSFKTSLNLLMSMYKDIWLKDSKIHMISIFSYFNREFLFQLKISVLKDNILTQKMWPILFTNTFLKHFLHTCILRILLFFIYLFLPHSPSYEHTGATWSLSLLPMDISAHWRAGDQTTSLAVGHQPISLQAKLLHNWLCAFQF